MRDRTRFLSAEIKQQGICHYKAVIMEEKSAGSTEEEINGWNECKM